MGVASLGPVDPMVVATSKPRANPPTPMTAGKSQGGRGGGSTSAPTSVIRGSRFMSCQSGRRLSSQLTPSPASTSLPPLPSSEGETQERR